MFFLFPHTTRNVLVFPELDIVELASWEHPIGNSFFYYDSCSENTLIGEIILGSSTYDVYEKQEYSSLLNVWNEISTSPYASSVILKNRYFRNKLLDYFDNLYNYIKGLGIPENYSFLLKERELIENISTYRVVHNINGKNNFIEYNMYKGKTGRLVTERNSFPILNLPKEERSSVFPNNSMFVSFDLASADFRSFLYIFGEKEEKQLALQEDLYTSFPGNTREEKKQYVFSLIYSTTYNSYLKRLNVREKAYAMVVGENEKFVTLKTPGYGRIIHIEKNRENLLHYFVSYVIQSVTNDIMIETACKVFNLLRNKKSRIAFLIHDEFVVDFESDEYNFFIPIIDKILRQPNRIGSFFWKKKSGTTFGGMELC